MARIILHVGTHKTGTTALQRALFAQRDLLLKSGICYDPWNRVLRGLKSSHHGFAQRLATFNLEDQANLAKYRLRLEQSLEQGLDVIISAESFYRHVDTEILDNHDAARVSFLDRVADFFSGLPVEVSICFRRPDRMAESMFKERAVNSDTKLEFLPYLEKFSERFDYVARVSEFEQRFGPAKVWCFEAAVAKGLVPAFLEQHGLLVPRIADAKAERKSISTRAVMWLQLAKRSVENMKKSERKTRWYYAASNHAHPSLAHTRGDVFWPDAETRDKFLRGVLSNFGNADFWNLPDEIPKEVTWTDKDHCEVEEHFEKWQQASSVLLQMRKMSKLAPYDSDDKIPRAIRLSFLPQRIAARIFNWRK